MGPWSSPPLSLSLCLCPKVSFSFLIPSQLLRDVLEIRVQGRGLCILFTLRGKWLKTFHLSRLKFDIHSALRASLCPCWGRKSSWGECHSEKHPPVRSHLPEEHVRCLQLSRAGTIVNEIVSGSLNFRSNPSKECEGSALHQGPGGRC